MKRTEIQYCKTFYENIIIKGFNNVATFDQIASEFGEEVFRIYVNGEQKYRRYANEILIESKTGEVLYRVYKGLVLSKENFNIIISIMKQAGNRLSEIRKSINNYKVKTIFI